ncbi:MAG: hypothetical protein V3V78_05065 [Candidatus Woesearchaeota archaeon]
MTIAIRRETIFSWQVFPISFSFTGNGFERFSSEDEKEEPIIIIPEEQPLLTLEEILAPEKLEGIERVASEGFSETRPETSLMGLHIPQLPLYFSAVQKQFEHPMYYVLNPSPILQRPIPNHKRNPRKYNLPNEPSQYEQTPGDEYTPQPTFLPSYNSIYRDDTQILNNNPLHLPYRKALELYTPTRKELFQYKRNNSQPLLHPARYRRISLQKPLDFHQKKRLMIMPEEISHIQYKTKDSKLRETQPKEHSPEQILQLEEIVTEAASLDINSSSDEPYSGPANIEDRKITYLPKTTRIKSKLSRLPKLVQQAKLQKKQDSPKKIPYPAQTKLIPLERKISECNTSVSECYAAISECYASTDSAASECYAAISECYAEAENNIKKARGYINQRKNSYACGGAMHAAFHHDDLNFTLKDYIRNGELQEGFKLAESVKVTDDNQGIYTLRAISTKNGEIEDIEVDKNSVYAQLDMALDSTIVWKNFYYIDTDTGEERSGLYLETLAEYHLEAKKLLGDEDEHGMKLNGIIVLINGIEPGQGTISLHDYKVKEGDILEIVYKNDAARYKIDKQEQRIAA